MSSHRVRVLVPVIALLAAVGCSPKRDGPLNVDEVFVGYTLRRVGILVGDPDAPEMDLRQVEDAGFTRSLLPGRVYVFEKVTSKTNEVLGTRDLPRRLRKAGARVTCAPKSGDDLVYRVVGEPIFRICFEIGRHKGVARVGGEMAKERWIELLIVAFK